ncbi:hypothetical protein PFICI_05211 [Pestalotiopsis fici W106-1]|uniref:Uncharacterized protein n=1 Tax=Pestalotiopsis fici (strain W106-1 / CGMCC3.15140) TaxID=1229662 RepID=W3XBB9_PESFW|nr:uncharacterized protein PFICI_05211 [Pestalotiopsis fici W106-1]ETS83335.1 hypothetical protein PFICI_05211 [Pestalotiopsis fici W106-1]
MSSRPREGQYRPTVPSPLNPTSPQTLSRQPKRYSRSRTSFKKGNGPVSPSQKLMRQKAEAAWKSLASRRTVEVHSATMEIVTRSAKPKIVQIEPRQSVGPASAAIKKTPSQAYGYGQQPLFVDAFDGGNMGLGIMVETDIEKQSMVAYSDFGALKASRPSNVLPSFEYRLRGPTIMTQQRILLTLSMICIMGILSSFFSHKEPS